MCSILREKTYPERLLFEQGGLLLLLRLLLQLVVAHCHDGEDEVDEVEGAEENDKKKEDNMPRTGSPGELDRVDDEWDHDGDDDGAMVRWLLNSFSEANSAADISTPTNNLGRRSDDLRNSFLVGLCCSQ